MSEKPISESREARRKPIGEAVDATMLKDPSAIRLSSGVKADYSPAVEGRLADGKMVVLVSELLNTVECADLSALWLP